MSDKMRWRYGETNPVVPAVDSATVIELGDLLWQDVDDAKPASDIKIHAAERIPDATSTIPGATAGPLEEEMFARKFLGVAMQRSRIGETIRLRVATTGVFEFDCPSGTFELGDLVGVDFELISDGTESGEKDEFLANQQVTKVTDSKYAIGRVAKFEHRPVTSVLVDIRSRVMGIAV